MVWKVRLLRSSQWWKKNTVRDLTNGSIKSLCFSIKKGNV
jgi:hypothetical protein